MSGDLKWFNPQDWGIEGKGWLDTYCYYDRLPRRAKRLLPDIWESSRSSTGFSCDFQTDASTIRARWRLRLPQLQEPNMSRATFSGLDLYSRDNGIWRWAGVAMNHRGQTAEDSLIADLSRENRNFRLYFPMRNRLSKVEIGIPRDASFVPTAPRSTKPIIYYGSSIVHGAFASRAGVVHSSALGRHLDRPVINLGFSGQAKMHEPLANFLVELDPAVFILDPLPNMDDRLVTERASRFIEILCASRPRTPIVMVEDFPMTHAWIRQNYQRAHEAKWQAFSSVFKKLKAGGHTNVHYVSGGDLIGKDSAGTVDGVHPNDVGYERLTSGLLEKLEGLVWPPGTFQENPRGPTNFRE